ncbi:Fc.00g108720.m01.CDS01 [Cosmosporella sp. VM-42]
MTTTVEIASAPTADTPGTCLFVQNEKRSYVFGRPSEGTQRAFNCGRLSMGHTEQIFLSGSIGWEQLGGLFGYMLSVGGAHESSREQLKVANEERRAKGMKLISQELRDTLSVHGGENLCHSLAACRPVILRQPLSVKTFEHRRDTRSEDTNNIEPEWQDDAIRVWTVPIRRTRSSSPQKRRRSSSPNGEEVSFKERDGPSHPGVARAVVEKAMFNGSIKMAGPLVPKKLSLVAPTDTAFNFENKVLSIYEGPIANDGELPDPDKIVWVIPTRDDKIDADDVNLIHRPLPSTTYSQTALSYIVKCQDRRGKFNPKVALDLGVQKQDFKHLTQGQTVQGKDGISVTPEMVMGDTQQGNGFIVADIASRDFLDPFMERPEWSNPQLMSNIVAVYWILGPGMANEAQILKFVQDHPKLKHVFCAQDTCPNMIALAGPAELQVRLRRIDPDRFSLLKFDNTVKGLTKTEAESGHIGNRINLMPRLMFDVKAKASFPNLLEAANAVTNEILDLAAQAKAETSDTEFLGQLAEDEKDIPNRDAEIIPLGTGSSVPGKYRNVSATLIRVPGIGNYLFDCGEGTLGQIRRLFGDEETASILRDMKCIVISHLHADHVLGAPSLIKAWYAETLNDNNAKMAISCVNRYRRFLEEISQVEDYGYNRLRFVSCFHGQDRELTTREDLGSENFGLNCIKRILVPHCWRSYATEIELTSGLRIAYSGDCRPSANFAKACEGTHLLIHECTFDDGMESHAKKKNHSTIGEALWVAKEMKARRLLLTHFSQRYVKANSLKDQVSGENMVALAAFDHMRVRLGDFKVAAAFQPAIGKMLAGME